MSNDLDSGWTKAAIVALPVSAAFGNHLLSFEIFGIVLFGFRLLFIGLCGYLIFRRDNICFKDYSESALFVRLAILWLLWGLCALLWALLIWQFDPAPGLLELAALFVGLASPVLMINLTLRTNGGLDFLRWGWVLSFICTAVIAFWEISSGKHLAGYGVNVLPESLLKITVFSTFENPNNYGAFLALCFPFLIWSFRLARGVKKILLFLSLAILVFLMIQTMGRLAEIALLLEITLFIAFNPKNVKYFVPSLAVAICFFFFVGAFGLRDNSALMKFASLPLEFESGGSANIRTNLVLNGISFLSRSDGMGVGPANYEQAIERVGFKAAPTENIKNPHNFWIEILSQYGVVVFIFFIAWLFQIVIRCWRAHGSFLGTQYRHVKLETETVLIGLAGYALAACENSSYIPQQINWIFLASVLAITVQLPKKKFLRV